MANYAIFIDSYIKGPEILKNIRAVNDTAVRGVKLIDEFMSLSRKMNVKHSTFYRWLKNYKLKYLNSNKSPLFYFFIYITFLYLI